MTSDEVEIKLKKDIIDLTQVTKTLEINSAQFGMLKLRRLTVKDHYNIPTLLKIEDPRVFSQKFIFNQIVDSSLTLDEFQKISNDELKKIIIHFIGFEKSLKEYFIEKSTFSFFESFKNSVKNYFDDSERKMRDSLQPVLESLQTVQNEFLQNFHSVIYPIQAAISDFSAPVLPVMTELNKYKPMFEISEQLSNQFRVDSEIIQNVLTPQIRFWQSFAQENQRIYTNFIQPLRHLQESLTKIKITFDQANKILKRYKWFICPCLPIEFFGAIIHVHRGKKKGRQKRINNLFIGYFTLKDYERLEAMVDSWRCNPLFKQRMKILKDCVKTLQKSKGKYNPSNVVLPTLIAQIDGILSDYIEMKGIVNEGKKWKDPTGKQLKNKEEGYKSLSPNQTYAFELPNYILLEILFQNAWRGQELTIPTTFSRHKIMHGEYIRYGRMENTIRAFMILDFLSYLE